MLRQLVFGVLVVLTQPFFCTIWLELFWTKDYPTRYNQCLYVGPRNWNWIYALRHRTHTGQTQRGFTTRNVLKKLVEDEEQTNIKGFLTKTTRTFPRTRFRFCFQRITKNPPRSEMEKNPKWIEGLTEDTRNDEADRPTMMNSDEDVHQSLVSRGQEVYRKMYQELGCGLIQNDKIL